MVQEEAKYVPLPREEEVNYTELAEKGLEGGEEGPCNCLLPIFLHFKLLDYLVKRQLNEQ